MLVHSLLLHARAAQPSVRSPAMAAGEALPVKAEVRSEPWDKGSQSDRAVHIEVIRPASARPGSGGRAVPADTVGRCGVTVLAVDETGFHTDSSTTRPRAMLTGTVFVKPRYRRDIAEIYGRCRGDVGETSSSSRATGAHASARWP